MVDLEKLAELDKRATGMPWADDERGIGEEGSATWELTRGDRALMVELRNNCAAIVAELRAARELAKSLRRDFDNRWPIVDDELVKYEAARDGGSK